LDDLELPANVSKFFKVLESANWISWAYNAIQSLKHCVTLTFLNFQPPAVFLTSVKISELSLL
jgi:hypothetical protein